MVHWFIRNLHSWSLLLVKSRPYFLRHRLKPYNYIDKTFYTQFSSECCLSIKCKTSKYTSFIWYWFRCFCYSPPDLCLAPLICQRCRNIMRLGEDWLARGEKWLGGVGPYRFQSIYYSFSSCANIFDEDIEERVVSHKFWIYQKVYRKHLDIQANLLTVQGWFCKWCTIRSQCTIRNINTY